MTVKELIEQLEAIEDKSKVIIVRGIDDYEVASEITVWDDKVYIE